METAKVPGLDQTVETTGVTGDDQMMILPIALPIAVVFVLILVIFTRMTVTIVGCLRRRRHTHALEVGMNYFTASDGIGE